MGDEALTMIQDSDEYDGDDHPDDVDDDDEGDNNDDDPEGDDDDDDDWHCKFCRTGSLHKNPQPKSNARVHMRVIPLVAKEEQRWNALRGLA